MYALAGFLAALVLVVGGSVKLVRWARAEWKRRRPARDVHIY
jgi:hypothetical protein